MKRMAGLERYHSHTVHQAYQEVFLSGIELEPFKQSVRFVEAVKQRCRQIEQTYHEPRRPRRDYGSTVVRTPVTLPAQPPTPQTSALTRLSHLGTLRGLYVVASHTGGYKITAKLNIAGRGNVYRYGIIQGLEQVEELLHRWIDKDRWTPDKQ